MERSRRKLDRRDFIRTGSAAGAAFALAPRAAAVRRRPIGAADEVRIGVVGTGGRGGGAVNDNLTANENVRLVAMADLNPDKCKRLLEALGKKHGDKLAVDEGSIYSGLDGYEKVIHHPDVDVVLLATPPGFRPYHIREAVKARKHVFAEKPVCVDPAGYRICIEAAKRAREQGTAIVTGTQYRRQKSFIEAIKRIHDGLIGEPIAMTARYCSRGIWYRARKPGMSDAEYQIENWMHFIWLSGDQIAEQAVHNVDVMNWVMGSPPLTAFGSGGRFTRPEDSEMWDSMSIDYEYPGDKLVSFQCRQLPNSASDTDNVVYCQNGIAYIQAFNRGARIVDRTGKELYKTKGNIGEAYRAEHAALVTSVRDGEPIVELEQTADSSLTAIMGRMAAYTAKKVAWDFVAKESVLDLFPKDLTMDSSLPAPAHAVPGKTKLI